MKLIISQFWWLCECSAIREIPEYEVSIPMDLRWAQELLGYNFSMVRQSNKIMAYVDALPSRLVKLIAQYCIIASILYSTDEH